MDGMTRIVLVSMDVDLAKCETGTDAESTTTHFGQRSYADFSFLARCKLICAGPDRTKAWQSWIPEKCLIVLGAS
jgi:hypothetical protein